MVVLTDGLYVLKRTGNSEGVKYGAFYMIEEVSTPDDDGGKRLRYLDNSLADDVIDVASVINCKKVRRFREIYLESEKVHLLRGRSFHQNGLVNMGVLIVFII